MTPLEQRANQRLAGRASMEDKPIDEKIADFRENQSHQGVVPYLTNAVNSMSRGLTQVVETPYNIVNRAPQLANLLPGEQGVEPLFDDPDPLINFMGENYPTMDQPGGISQPNPNYPRTGRFMEDVGLGVGSMGLTGLSTALPGVAGKFAQFFNAPVQAAPKAAVAGEVAASAGAAGGREIADQAELGPVGSFLAEFLGALGPGSLTYSGPEAAGKIFSREGGGETLEAMERLGMRPSVGVTGNEMAGQMENAAGIVPILGSSARKVQRQQFDEFGEALTDAAAKVRPDDAVARTQPIMMGEQVRDIAEGGLEKIKTGFSGREDAIMDTIGAKTGVDVTKTRKVLTSMLDNAAPEQARAIKYELGLLDEMATSGKVINNNPYSMKSQDVIPYSKLRDWRTGVGRRTDQPSLDGGNVKRIYASLTEDLQKVADDAGVGNDFKELMADQARSNSKTGDKTRLASLVDKDSEKSLTMFNQSLKNPEKIETFKRNASPEQWDEFTANTMEYLGVAADSSQGAAGDAISANTFLTNWNKMDPRTRNIMFDDDLGTMDTLNDLATVAEGMKHRGHGQNFSNTAGVGMGAGAIMGGPLLYGDVAGAAVNTGLSYAAIKGLMSETLAKWAAGRTPSAQGTISARMPGAAVRAATEEQE